MAEKLNIYQRLHEVMKAINYVQKESKKVNNQYTFVSHDAVTAKIRQPLIDNGILPIVRVVGHKQDGNRTEANIEVDFVNIDVPEERVTVPAFGYGIDPQDKGPGKAISYAFKYAVLKTFALETGDDPEKDMIDHKPANTTPITPTAGVWEECSEEEQEFLTGIAAEVSGMIAEGDITGAVAHIDSLKLTADEKVALWTRFDSKQRSAMKRAINERKAA